ncbi:hypothetical protein M422DRAFT_24416 [Sphaerobolus stellatus SS14]|nr:hypothetical protein M422DRAFT_24416 [Sphaerobolus stellatus SS14]
MDNNPEHSSAVKAGQPSTSPGRKRSRASSEDEDRAVEEKRLKARERQRRKRERDRSGRDKSSTSSGMGTQQFPPAATDSDPGQMSIYGPAGEMSNGRSRVSDLAGLSPEEAAKKERIRSAARERQRKHRAAVKAKRMAELGMSMVNSPPHEGQQPGVGYLNEHGQYVMEDPNTQHQHHPLSEPPFSLPPPHASAGTTFASTLMAAFSCQPMLKQQLFRTLHISDDELASFEPVIAAAWDHWDHERAMHYAAAAAANANANSDHPHPPPPTSYLPPHPPQHPHGHLYSSDFRTRFHRPLVAPFPQSAPILRPEGTVVHPANGSATTNGSYADQRDRDGGDSDEHEDEHEDGRSTPPPPNTTDSIDPALEAQTGGTSDVRGERIPGLAHPQQQQHPPAAVLPPAQTQPPQQEDRPVV